MHGYSNGRMRGSACPEAWVCPVPEPVGLKVWANPHQSQPSCSRRAGWKRGRTAQNSPRFSRGSLQLQALAIERRIPVLSLSQEWRREGERVVEGCSRRAAAREQSAASNSSFRYYRVVCCLYPSYRTTL